MKLSKNYIIKHILDSDILVDVKSNFNGVIKLNKTSIDIIDCINMGMSINEIIDYLDNKYDIDRETLINDTNEFINDCLNKGIFIND